jgi:hypothetical protein
MIFHFLSHEGTIFPFSAAKLQLFFDIYKKNRTQWCDFYWRYGLDVDLQQAAFGRGGTERDVVETGGD